MALADIARGLVTYGVSEVGEGSYNAVIAPGAMRSGYADVQCLIPGPTLALIDHNLRSIEGCSRSLQGIHNTATGVVSCAVWIAVVHRGCLLHGRDSSGPGPEASQQRPV